MAQLTPTLRRGAALLLLLSLAGCRDDQPKPGTVLDEAKQAQRTVESFTAADENYFKDMDGGVALSTPEVMGRNTWLVWTGGNDRLWDKLATVSVGNLDLLKTLSSHPGLKFSRDNRWNYLGLVNEPCFDKAAGPDDKRFGLWLDQRRADCAKDPFENEKRYPGVVIGARGKNLPVGSFYGYATGVVGLRLFPNPAFDEAAAKKWDAKRYYEDPSYYNDKDLIRPYRVGMSCAFCHVGPNPVKPPADPEHPKWENLSSNVGAQYFWVDRIFSWQADPSSFPFQLFHTSRPGALDTSLVSTDSINNPRTMNAVYGLQARLDIAKRWGKETLAGGNLDNKQFNDFVKTGPLTQYFQAPNTVWTPRVLKDGSDSVGALGALNRVYLNIGLFSEEWLLHFNPLVGGKTITPIQIADARKNSVYWQSTEQQTVNMALFFLKSTDPHKLKDAPGGEQYLSHDTAQLSRGKVVFAENCARCHSSKLPPKVSPLDPTAGCAGPDYLACFKKYWDWTKTEDFKSQMRQIVQADDFLKDNYLSTELRVPVTLLQTNACSPLATNALKGNIWDNFSSKTYKDLPSVGSITVHNPFTGEPWQYKMPAGGRGYTRPASLISVWSTAPLLLNNSLGKFNPSPSVAARMESFDNSIQQLLWPEKREKDKVLGDKVPGVIDRTTARSYLRVPTGYLPDTLQELQGPLQRYLPWLFGKDGVELGPIPAGTPVNLIANLQVTLDNPSLGERLKHDKKLLDLLLKIKHDLKALPPGASDEEARKVFANLVKPMLELSTCPDFVVNRGHYFGTGYMKDEAGLSDSDKYALIAFLKTF
ncbi:MULTISPECIES: hypothetical protein [Chromobacterium]|uniref:Cytochrome c domain-containing protein n=1 Tax=Chromobacterium aquaticum TaxID=467180 RepID=A0ABV8ZN86_9NEIS|nr:hypothetical protein [Chromobacterium aquaticum]MCD5364013.1 hypothetical protein [Chromobacterium aquaticum]